MSNRIPPEIAEIRDELASKHAVKENERYVTGKLESITPAFDHDCHNSYICGFNAAAELLLKQKEGERLDHETPDPSGSIGECNQLKAQLSEAMKTLTKALVPIDMGLGLLPTSPETKMMIETLTRLKRERNGRE